ncbi:hypothetical protein NNJEOMEG_00338 [Fundidesulfovibrio magnetotacticus]|uniref:YkgJ family cysteine cluster protein n=1 Tax=Fundidesulfovibrio magnetotacticus TaxID=2730080 RepID=A0A6V8LIH4_9BACT|nr:YkgJ family cysteine cluster protein [Fundidesulfovibrio magnetotacticus]GFK92513.1 hypothetical protein NNJEOMEG_00338 [Fundidesulfovibrio magnetotacticus]
MDKDADVGHDAASRFLDSLPELRPGEPFRFACHPDVPCYNACCSDLALMLTPYDVLRLRRQLGLSSRDFIARHAVMAQAPDTGFPMLRLAMREDLPGLPCPFVTRAGCSVYPGRPGACRTYPLGRATKTGPDGEVVARFFVVREPHCRGFEQARDWTSASWLDDQDLAEYNRSNDRYMLLLAHARDRGATLNPKQANTVFLAAYNVDAFRDFLRDTRMLERLELADEDRQGILDDEERRLRFAMDWLELALFGLENNLRKKA